MAGMVGFAVLTPPYALEVGGWEVIKQYVADGPGHQHRHRHLPHRRRPHPPRRAIAGEIFSVAELRRGGEEGEISFAAGPGFHRIDPAADAGDAGI